MICIETKIGNSPVILREEDVKGNMKGDISELGNDTKGYLSRMVHWMLIVVILGKNKRQRHIM